MVWMQIINVPVPDYYHVTDVDISWGKISNMLPSGKHLLGGLLTGIFCIHRWLKYDFPNVPNPSTASPRNQL